MTEPAAGADAPPVALLANRYRIVHPIGRGGMGDVYLAEHVALRRACAIKMLPTPSLTDTEALARFRREAHNAAQLSHPHIAAIHDFGEDAGRPFLAMELIEGPTLAEAVATGGAMPPDRVRRIIAQVASALDAAHAAGIVHRDLKPSNVMLAHDAQGRDVVKLVDFGISRAIGRADQQITTTDAVIGTPGFIAPEQFRGPVDDVLVDVYALGVLTVYLLHGEVPTTAPGLGLSIGPVAEANGWAPPLRDAIVGAVTTNRASRWSSAGAFSRALDTALSPEAATTVAPRRPGAGGAASPEASRAPARDAAPRQMPAPSIARRPVTILTSATLLGAALYAAIVQPWSDDAPDAPRAANMAPASTVTEQPARWTTSRHRSSSGVVLEMRHPAEWTSPPAGPLRANGLPITVPALAMARLLPDSSALLMADLEQFAEPRLSAAQFADEWMRTVGAGDVRISPLRETATGIFQATLLPAGEPDGEPVGVLQLAMQSAGGRTQVLWRAMIGRVSRHPDLLTVLSDSLHVVES